MQQNHRASRDAIKRALLRSVAEGRIPLLARMNARDILGVTRFAAFELVVVRKSSIASVSL